MVVILDQIDEGFPVSHVPTKIPTKLLTATHTLTFHHS